MGGFFEMTSMQKDSRYYPMGKSLVGVLGLPGIFCILCVSGQMSGWLALWSGASLRLGMARDVQCLPVKPSVVYFGHWVKVPFIDLCMFMDVDGMRLIANKRSTLINIKESKIANPIISHLTLPNHINSCPSINLRLAFCF